MNIQEQADITIQKLDKGARVEVIVPGQPVEWITFRSMSEAQTASEMIADRLSPEAESVTFGQFADLWFERHVRTECCAETQGAYLLKLKDLVRYFGTMMLLDISPSTVRSFYESLRATKKASVRNAILQFLKSVLNRARDWYFIPSNPADHLDEDDLLSGSEPGKEASHD